MEEKEEVFSFKDLMELNPSEAISSLAILRSFSSFVKITYLLPSKTLKELLMHTEEEINEIIREWKRNIRLDKVKDKLATMGLGFRPSNFTEEEWMEILERRYNKYYEKGGQTPYVVKKDCLEKAKVPVEYRELIAFGAGVKAKEKIENNLFNIAIKRKLKNNKKNILESNSKQPKISIAKSNERLSDEQMKDFSVDYVADLFKKEDASIIKDMISIEFVKNNSKKIKLNVMQDLNLTDDEKIEAIDKVTQF